MLLFCSILVLHQIRNQVQAKHYAYRIVILSKYQPYCGLLHCWTSQKIKCLCYTLLELFGFLPEFESYALWMRCKNVLNVSSNQILPWTLMSHLSWIDFIQFKTVLLADSDKTITYKSEVLTLDWGLISPSHFPRCCNRSTNLSDSDDSEK